MIAIAWVEEAFGTKIGLLCGYFHWVAGATDNALYPTLFLEYVVSYLVNLEQRAMISGDSTPWFSPFTHLLVHDDAIRFLLCVIITILLSMLNFLGLEIVGNVSIFVCILSMSPFFILFLLGLPKVDPSRWTVMPQQSQVMTIDDDGAYHPGWLILPNFAGVIWRPFINNLYWNLNSFDVGASFAGEVKNPERVFPRAMFLSFVFVVFSYVFTLFVALGATNDSQNEWKAGHLSVVASEVVGPWLGAWTVFAAAIGNIALYEAEMSGDAYQLMGMGDRGLVPKIFSKRSKFGTPTYGIMLGTVVIIILSVASFDAIVEMLNFAYSLSLLLEYAAFVKLRITDDDGKSRS
jgi:amino acid transporter